MTSSKVFGWMLLAGVALSSPVLAQGKGRGAKSADDLVEVKQPPLSMQLPAAWKAQEEDGTRRYSDPSGDAYFLLDIGQTAREMSGDECREKILTGMKAKGVKKMSIGDAPAAKLAVVDKAEKADDEVHTVTFIGCDGKTTWSLVFHYVGKQKARFAPLADKIAKSIEYQ